MTDCIQAKVIVGICIFAETMIFCYIPNLGSRLSQFRGRWLNEASLNNATSGALLALSMMHLLPEGFEKAFDGHEFCHIDIRGMIVALPILFLVTIDFLAGHHCGKNIQENENIQTITGLSIIMEEVPEFRTQDGKDVALSLVSTADGNATLTTSTRLEILWIKIKQMLLSKALYLLITFYGHSVLEGVILGTAVKDTALYGMAFGIIAHKWAECIVLTNTVMNVVNSKIALHVYSVLFSLCVPIGMAFGSVLLQGGSGSETVTCIFKLLAVGFFIYLSFELLTGHDDNEVDDRFVLWATFIFGATIMSSVLAITEYIEQKNG
ncbi:Zinc-iron permease [Babesia duncani]|uniref:Zinc-iron permease n=1 Tax=Babesia duncani TaxID=323732 RepID=A0AAD9PJQ1_9APIC|nr:Zinc-iron permease [Babesia duncani]